jgi:glycosyltransferase involved in cell wall biosynthesis
MKQSIIIINKDDKEVENTIKAIYSYLNDKTVECVVVDASNHKLDYIKEAYSKVKWFNFTPSVTTKSTIPEQRNFGIKKSVGEVIVFIDASCVPVDSHWLSELTNPIFKNMETITRGMVSNIANYYQITEKSAGKIYVTEAPTINMAVARTVFNEIGVFDETFSYGSDMDFTWRAVSAGYKIRLIETAPVYHNFGDTKDDLKRYIKYGKARAKLYRKHPKHLGRARDYELKSLIYLVIILLSPISLLFPLYILVPILLFSLHVRNNTFHEVFVRCAFSYGLILGLLNQN